MKCYFGDHYVDPTDRDTYHMITAWVSGPKRDGATLRENTDNVACKRCVDVRKLGQDPSEGNLFEARPSTMHDVDVTHPDYAKGWRHGFFDLSMEELESLAAPFEYAHGYRAGRELDGYLVGFFHFEETS